MTPIARPSEIFDDREARAVNSAAVVAAFTQPNTVYVKAASGL